jgi:hypothetical protein
VNNLRYPAAAALFVLLCADSALSQVLARAAPLPDAPSAVSQSAPAPLRSEAEGVAQITGTVLDKQGNPVSSATVRLIPLGKFDERTTTSLADGSFTFPGLPPNQYQLTVTAVGLDLYTSGEFTVRSGASVALPAIALTLSTNTTVNVVASEDQIAVAQIHEQEQQRVFGVFQNFYTSYIWDAQPMPVGQKYILAFRSLYDPPQFLIVAGLAGAEQYEGTYPGYGPGIEGYGKRYGAALAVAVTSRILGSAVLPSVLHQDPRYFYQGSGSIASRTVHAASYAFITRGDNGKRQPNYSYLLGGLASSGIANLYHPASSRGVGDTFQTFGIDLAGNIAGNLFREFLLRHLEKVPAFANGKH